MNFVTSNVLWCWVCSKLLVICRVVELEVGFIDIILSTKHDLCGLLISRLNNNFASLSEVPEGWSFCRQEVVTRYFACLFSSLSTSILTFLMYVSRAASLRFRGIHMLRECNKMSASLCSSPFLALCMKNSIRCKRLKKLSKLSLTLTLFIWCEVGQEECPLERFLSKSFKGYPERLTTVDTPSKLLDGGLVVGLLLNLHCHFLVQNCIFIWWEFGGRSLLNFFLRHTHSQGQPQWHHHLTIRKGYLLQLTFPDFP